MPLHCRLPIPIPLSEIEANTSNSLNGATAYTAGLNFVVADFNFNPSGSKTYLPEAPIAAFSLYIFGIAFAPIVTPHIVERVGRSYVYFFSIVLCGLFLLGGQLKLVHFPQNEAPFC